MMKHKIFNSVSYQKWLRRLNTELYEPTNQNSSFKFLSQRNSKRYYKTLGNSVINNPMSSPFLILTSYFTQCLCIDKLIYIPNDDTHNYLFLQFMVETFEQSTL